MKKKKIENTTSEIQTVKREYEVVATSNKRELKKVQFVRKSLNATLIIVHYNDWKMLLK